MWFVAETERRDEAAKNAKKKIHDRKVLKKRQFHSEKIRKFFGNSIVLNCPACSQKTLGIISYKMKSFLPISEKKDENKKTLT